MSASSRSNGEVQARERRSPASRAPRLGQRAGQVGLLGEDVGGPVAHAARLDQQHLRVGVEQVEEQRARPSVSHGSHDSMPSNDEALGEPLPLLAAPRLGADQLGGPRADLVGRQQLAAREDLDLGEVGGRALVVDARTR